MQKHEYSKMGFQDDNTNNNKYVAAAYGFQNIYRNASNTVFEIFMGRPCVHVCVCVRLIKVDQPLFTALKTRFLQDPMFEGCIKRSHNCCSWMYKQNAKGGATFTEGIQKLTLVAESSELIYT